MATTKAHRIVLQGEVRYEEDIAGGAIKPGHLIEIYPNTGVRNVRVHSKAGGWAERAFAIENALEGLRPGATPPGVTVDTAYAATDLVPYVICRRGTVVSAMLKGNANYAIGDKLMSNGDGTLQKDTVDSTVIKEDCIAVVHEALDLSASAGVPAARGVVRCL